MAAKTDKTTILVLNTGGTLTMKNSDDNKGLAPGVTGDLVKWLLKFGILNNVKDEKDRFELKGKENIECAFKSTEKLIDSSDIQIKHWKEIADKIEEEYEQYDGFVVLHGTDTMVYTASALSFIFENLKKPVVITGAQIPIYEKDSDGEDNFKSAVYFAANAASKIAEVVICFNNKIFRGNRTAKIDCVKYDAYESPNYPVLATVSNEGHIEVNRSACRQPKKESAELELKTLSDEVCLLKLFPGIKKEKVTSFMEDYKGMVLETYGAGNAPSDLVEALKENDKVTVVVNVTQCLRGGVTMVYETGKALQDAGVIPCGDMTTSAAFTKLCYLLEKKKKQPIDIAKEMNQDLKGEITNMS